MCKNLAFKGSFGHSTAAQLGLVYIAIYPDYTLE